MSREFSKGGIGLAIHCVWQWMADVDLLGGLLRGSGGAGRQAVMRF